jgi:hypothetical protein
MPKKKGGLLYLLLLFTLPLIGIAQKADSLTVTNQHSGSDSLVVKKKHPYPSPLKATIYSAIIPGLGQAYNKRYWKIPIVYAGLGVAAYFIITNQQLYDMYRSAYVTRTTTGNDPYVGIYSTNDLLTIENFYHRNRDLSIIGAAFIYLLNVVDADVDAELHSFNVSDDISFHFTPNLVPDPWSGSFTFQPGFSLVKKF